jgi:peptide deformylase
MKLPILIYPNKKLRIKANLVLNINIHIKTLINNMFETMYASRGIGLAATQVDQHYQIIVIDIPSEKMYQKFKLERLASEDYNNLEQTHPLCFINPKIIKRSGIIQSKEGCLSVPSFEAFINRSKEITVIALDQHGKQFELSTQGLLAICIQHEIDHLQGKLFVDYISKIKQDRLKKRLIKLNA